MNNKNKINDLIMKRIYRDLNETYWESDLWESVKRGSIRESITSDHELVDEMDYDYKKVWKEFCDYEHPFLNDFDKLMYKWKQELGR